ncbi:MAG: tetraacyldisaccharide 4'-kinase [Acidobacteria bacterium]|nr:tetraacyldisaccharide 4'-kinase [Acidobacteriota bacterium]
MNGGITRALLYPPAKLYQLGVRARLALYENKIFKINRLSAPVISIGNLTVGGTGKTPCVAFIALLLRDASHDVAILSRGYKRESEGLIEVSNEKEILRGPRESGDEPYLLANSCPGVRVVVDRDRYQAGRWLAERGSVSVFILDDGFQHLQLARDLNLLLIDAGEPLEEAELVPLGRLREPLAGMRRADAVIVTRSDQAFDRRSLERTITKYSRRAIPIIYAYHEITNLRRLDNQENWDISSFSNEKVAALSCIARPERFIEDLRRLGMRLVFRRDFPDHHRYNRQEFDETVEAALAAGAHAVITTEKDAANLSVEILKSSRLPVFAAKMEFRWEDEEALKRIIQSVFIHPS